MKIGIDCIYGYINFNFFSENTSTGFSLLSLVSSAIAKNHKGSNGAYSDMYALHERGESQSEAEQGKHLSQNLKPGAL